MELLQLRYFYETAQSESITKTAQKFMVSVPSVSATIKKLETELGTPLFNRSSNRVTLNENGKQFLKSASLILSEIDSAKYKYSKENIDTREIKILVLAMRNSLTAHIVNFKRTYHDISFITIFDFNETNYDNYDIIIAEESRAPKGFESIEIVNTRLKIAAAKDSPLCNRKLTLKELENEPFVSMGDENDMQKTLTKACKRVGFTPKVVVKCNDAGCFDKCLREGIGIGVIRDRGPLFPLITMEYLDITDFDYPYVVCCFYRERDYYGNVKDFIDLLRK